MKYLLQSKKFRKKIYKWLMMYIGLLCLVTSVVTYSRYISKAVKNDSAKVAKFKVDIYPKNNYGCDTTSGELICSASNVRPKQYLEYNFIVDLSQIEVKTEFQLIFTPNNSYKNVFKVKELTLISYDGTIYNNPVTVREENGYEYYYYTNNEIIPTTGGGIREYKLKIENKNYDEINNTTPLDTEIKNIIQIGYKATQMD